MTFSFKPRSARWAGQPSTFFLLLNACLLTGLLHYWSGIQYSGPQVSIWVGTTHDHHQHAIQADTHGNVNTASVSPALATTICNGCGPKDVFCSKYGADILARSRGYEGTNTRLHRVLRDAEAGKPIKISILGGSVTRGQGVKRNELWVNVFGDWWRSRFSGPLTLQNGAVAATGTSYMSMCFNEHIDDDADLVLTEFAINDQRTDANAENFELLLRQLLQMPKQPAVVNLQVFGLGYAQLTTGGDLHTAVAQYYDTPVVSLRNALLPQLLQTPSAAAGFFTKLHNGKPDFKHINARGHGMLGDLLAAYMERQLCAVPHDSTPVSPRGSSDAAQLLFDVDTLPSHRLFQSALTDPPAQRLDPFCSSTRTLKHPLTPVFNDGRWANWTYTAPGGTPKAYVRATEPGALIGFAVPVRGGLGRVRLQYLQSSTFELGVVKCWLDDEKDKAVHVDGFWKSPLNLASMSVISKTASVGDHMLWCELTSHSSSPGKGTEFRLIGIDAA